MSSKVVLRLRKLRRRPAGETKVRRQRRREKRRRKTYVLNVEAADDVTLDLLLQSEHAVTVGETVERVSKAAMRVFVIRQFRLRFEPVEAVELFRRLGRVVGDDKVASREQDPELAAVEVEEERVESGKAANGETSQSEQVEKKESKL